jgi:hypothetical protein
MNHLLTRFNSADQVEAVIYDGLNNAGLKVSGVLLE